MYLSRIALDAKRRETMRILACPHLLHGAVEKSFKGNRQRNLWRIDWVREICYLLVLSSEIPDFTHISEQLGFVGTDQKWETKDYDKLLARLEAGQAWRFRLCANPIRSSIKDKDEVKNRGKVFAHVTHDQQRQWLLKRAEDRGFILDENSFDVVHTQWRKFSKGKEGENPISIRTATYEGVLTISDLECFKNTLQCGIGRAKAYGCGLLTIARLRDSINA